MIYYYDPGYSFFSLRCLITVSAGRRGIILHFLIPELLECKSVDLFSFSFSDILLQCLKPFICITYIFVLTTNT